MAEELNEMLAKLKFSDEESKRVFCQNISTLEMHGYEAWAVGKTTSKKKKSTKRRCTGC